MIPGPMVVAPTDPRYQNFVSPDFPVQFFDDTGSPINLTGVNASTGFTVALQTISATPTLVICECDATITDAANGKVSFSFGLDDLAIVALFAMYFTVQLPNESTPRAFPFVLLDVQAWNGGPLVTTNVNVSQITATSQPLPTGAAQEAGNLQTAVTRLTSILTALGLPLTVNDTATGTTDIAPANGAPTQTNANNNTVYTLASQANHWAVQNNSPNAIYVQLGNGNVATLGSMAIAANGGAWREDAPCTVFNIYSTATTSINGNTANGIVIWGRS